MRLVQRKHGATLRLILQEKVETHVEYSTGRLFVLYEKICKIDYS